MSFKRSEKRMREIEVKLRRGMAGNGIGGEAQDAVVKSITSFALYGFPESHAASFALIAYASAYLKCRYPAAFTAALLNNQPMGFYHPATLIKDAQRHGLHFKPVDVCLSRTACTVEEERGQQCVRLGLNFVKGLRREMASAIAEESRRSPFRDMDDLAARPVGAMWAGPQENETPSPLVSMTLAERLLADFRNTGLTIGPHPMRLHRERLKTLGIRSATEVRGMRDGQAVRVS